MSERRPVPHVGEPFASLFPHRLERVSRKAQATSRARDDLCKAELWPPKPFLPEPRSLGGGRQELESQT